MTVVVAEGYKRWKKENSGFRSLYTHDFLHFPECLHRMGLMFKWSWSEQNISWGKTRSFHPQLSRVFCLHHFQVFQRCRGWKLVYLCLFFDGSLAVHLLDIRGNIFFFSHYAGLIPKPVSTLDVLDCWKMFCYQTQLKLSWKYYVYINL